MLSCLRLILPSLPWPQLLRREGSEDKLGRSDPENWRELKDDFLNLIIKGLDVSLELQAADPADQPSSDSDPSLPSPSTEKSEATLPNDRNNPVDEDTLMLPTFKEKSIHLHSNDSPIPHPDQQLNSTDCTAGHSSASSPSVKIDCRGHLILEGGGEGSDNQTSETWSRADLERRLVRRGLSRVIRAIYLNRGLVVVV